MTKQIPAPWHLKGRGYIFLVRPEAVSIVDARIPEPMVSSWVGGPGCLMWVDYESSDAGPYRELLYIPGAFRSGLQLRYSITRIYVTTEASVINGRRNWGIPKELADISWKVGKEGVEICCRGPQGLAGQMAIRHLPGKVPVNTGLIPKILRTFVQYWEGQTFEYPLMGRGWLKPVQVTDCQFEEPGFPALCREDILAGFAVDPFRLVFPEARLGSTKITKSMETMPVGRH